MRLADSIAELMEDEEEEKHELTEEQKAEEEAIYNGSTIDLGKLAPDIVVEKPQVEEQVEEPVEDTTSPTELTEEEKAIFSYFIPIAGMEQSLCRALSGLRAKVNEPNTAKNGNIAIQGGVGSGKTTLATNIIKVLQEQTGKPTGNIGKIDGKRLNEKDIKQLFSAVAGGCLIIEKAGQISSESAVTLSILMESDNTGIIVVLEDTKENLQQLLHANASFAKKFTERINIPVLTIDELVNFGKIYALELGYNIDEMGVLALYDRINIKFRPDQPVYVTGVKEIVDEAIDHAERGGLGGFFGRLGSKHYDDEGNLILQEKDFQDE
jgi:energy-coupling factor transporter ATP-binding protein EcfA2